MSKSGLRLEYNCTDGVLCLTLNSPNNRNALSRQMMGDLQSALDDAARDAEVRVIKLSANGPAFCAGHDLKELTQARSQKDGGLEFFQETMTQCSTLMQSIVHHPRPIIAEVAGMASAAGCQLVASCDLAIAGQNAKFNVPGVHIGLFCSTPMVALSRNVSRKHAMEMLLTGEFIDAARAETIGLVNRVLKDSELAAHALDLAISIAGKSAKTVTIGKTAFYRQVEMELEEAYQHTSQVMAENMMAQDAREGIEAFIQKRTPKWKDC